MAQTVKGASSPRLDLHRGPSSGRIHSSYSARHRLSRRSVKGHLLPDRDRGTIGWKAPKTAVRPTAIEPRVRPWVGPLARSARGGTEPFNRGRPSGALGAGQPF
jgi:hypothetical protein